MDTRREFLQQWLNETCHLVGHTLIAMPGDASFRRYFRIFHHHQTYIAMDAPPPVENTRPFVAIANALRVLKLNVPDIIANDFNRGFLLLTDFGDDLFLKKITADNAEKLYTRALDALHILSECREVTDWPLPFFSAEIMRNELELFKEWFLRRYLGLTLNTITEKNLNTCFDFLVKKCEAQPSVFMHRDYHSANLMVLQNDQVGILDFQDAFMGPVTYDLVSLLRDCYITLPETLVNKLALHYLDEFDTKNKISADEFLYWFDLMGLQRHLKALLTFSRKFKRDHNANYLQHIPRTLQYIIDVSARYAECQPLNIFLKENKCAQ